MTLFLAYQSIITFSLLVFFCICIWNLFTFYKLPVLSESECLRLSSTPFVSICIPARNEASSIRDCVESLCKQHYTAYEVLILNDQSSDSTQEILEELTEQFPTIIRVLQGKEIESGWVGKSWACHQLSQQAHGEYIIFTDADTIHQPSMIVSSLRYIQQSTVDFFSIVPFEITSTWSEKVVIPIVHFLYFVYVPNSWILHRKEIKFSAANGQFMFFKRTVYDAIGGHKSVKNALVEDVSLAKNIKRNGFRIALCNGSDIVSCRMYSSFTEVFRGFSKNFFAGMNYSILIMLLFQLQFLFLFIVPFVTVISAIFNNTFTIEQFWLPLFQYSIAVVMRLIISSTFKLDFTPAFFHPFSIVLAMAIGINSVRWAYSVSGSEWKGRRYTKAQTL